MSRGQDLLSTPSLFFEPSEGGAGGTPATAERRIPRALLIDDSPDCREMYAWSLRAAGWLVEEAPGGLAALFAATASRPDVVVLDLEMPDLDGFEVLKQLKGHERTRHIPIVVCSCNDSLATRLRARSAGCAAFVAKPCLPERLIEVLDRFIVPVAPRALRMG